MYRGDANQYVKNREEWSELKARVSIGGTG
jgi:hypothetical protein